MHKKYVSSPSSKDGSGVGVNTTGRKPSNTAAFPSTSSALTNEVPSLSGNCSNDDGGTDLLYPDSVSESITSPINPSSKGGLGVHDNTSDAGAFAFPAHNKYACSPSSKGGSGVGVNTTGRMPSNTAFLSSSSAPTNESVPSLAGNCNNDGGGDLLYPDSVSESISSPIKMHDAAVNRQEETPKKVEALKQEKAKDLSISSPIKMHDAAVNRQEETPKKVEALKQEKAKDLSGTTPIEVQEQKYPWRPRVHEPPLKVHEGERLLLDRSPAYAEKAIVLDALRGSGSSKCTRNKVVAKKLDEQVREETLIFDLTDEDVEEVAKDEGIMVAKEAKEEDIFYLPMESMFGEPDR